MPARPRFAPTSPALASTSPTTKASGSEVPTSLELVARTGNPAPGTASGVRFSDLSSTDAERAPARSRFAPTSPALASVPATTWASGRPIRPAPCSSSPAKALSWKSRPASSARSATWASSTDTGNSDGRASAFNNLGQLVFWARFTNGTQGVFVSSLVAHLPGDFNNDGTVDAADYVVWRKNDGTQTGYDAWRANFGRTLFAGSGSALLPPPSRCRPPCPSRPASLLAAARALHSAILRRRRTSRTGATAGLSHQCHRTSTSLCDSCHRAPRSQLAPASTALGATIEFDASAKSPAVIPFDPDAIVEGRSGYVSGRVPTNVKGPVIGGTNINTLLGADAFYSAGLYRHQRGHRQY